MLQPIFGLGRIPGDGVRRIGHFGAEVRTIELELHAGDAEFRSSSGGNRRGTGNIGALCRRGDGNSRQILAVIHGDRDRAGRGLVVRLVEGNGGKRVQAIVRLGRIPGDGVRRIGHFGAEVRTIALELHAGDAEFRSSSGGNRRGTGNIGALCRRGDGNSRQILAVIHGDRDRAGRGLVVRLVEGNGGKRVRAIARLGGIPGDGVRRIGHFGAEVRSVELELHAGDAKFRSGSGGDWDRVGNIGALRRRGGGNRRQILGVVDGARDRAGRSLVVRFGEVKGGERVRAIARLGGIPGDGVRRIGHFGAEVCV